MDDVWIHHILPTLDLEKIDVIVNIFPSVQSKLHRYHRLPSSYTQLVKQHLIEKKLDPERACKVLKETRSVITGSFVLQSIIEKRWESDIDLMTIADPHPFIYEVPHLRLLEAFGQKWEPEIETDAQGALELSELGPAYDIKGQKFISIVERSEARDRRSVLDRDDEMSFTSRSLYSGPDDGSHDPKRPSWCGVFDDGSHDPKRPSWCGVNSTGSSYLNPLNNKTYNYNTLEFYPYDLHQGVTLVDLYQSGMKGGPTQLSVHTSKLFHGSGEACKTPIDLLVINPQFPRSRNSLIPDLDPELTPTGREPIFPRYDPQPIDIPNLTMRVPSVSSITLIEENIDDFDLSMCQVYFDGEYVYTKYLKTLEMKGHSYIKSLVQQDITWAISYHSGKTKSNNVIRLLDRIKRYHIRGFSFDNQEEIVEFYKSLGSTQNQGSVPSGNPRSSQNFPHISISKHSTASMPFVKSIDDICKHYKK